MAPSTSSALLNAEETLVTCPLCHTADARLTEKALAAGGDWRCRTCGQNWTAGRLATSAAYAVWAAAYDLTAGAGSIARMTASL